MLLLITFQNIFFRSFRFSHSIKDCWQCWKTCTALKTKKRGRTRTQRRWLSYCNIEQRIHAVILFRTRNDSFYCGFYLIKKGFLKQPEIINSFLAFQFIFLITSSIHLWKTLFHPQIIKTLFYEKLIWKIRWWAKK